MNGQPVTNPPASAGLSNSPAVPATAVAAAAAAGEPAADVPLSSAPVPSLSGRLVLSVSTRSRMTSASCCEVWCGVVRCDAVKR